MKQWLLAAALVCFSSSAQAGPYFRLIDPSHPQPVAGALLDPRDLGNSEASSFLPIFTHSTADGCAFPSIVCSDWTPLAVGFSMNAGQLTLNVAPLANVLPWVQSAALALTPSSWASVRQFFTPGAAGPVTFSAGPVWQYKQETNKGYFKVFTGLALHF